jgi:hypothetical protein
VKLFISWSKNTSHKIAIAVRDWLPLVVTSAEPWVSSEDIAKGTLGSKAIMEELAGTGQGVICLTPQNLGEPWLNFEAGALASHTNPRVRTLLFDLKPRDIKGPLWDFQHTDISDREDMLKFVKSVNEVCTPKLTERQLNTLFEKSWPDLVSELDGIRAAQTVEVASDALPRSTGTEVMVEVLDRVRSMERNQYQLTGVVRTLRDRIGAVAASVGVNDHPLTGQFIAFPDMGVGRIVTFGEQWVEVAFDRHEGHWTMPPQSFEINNVKFRHDRSLAEKDWAEMEKGGSATKAPAKKAPAKRTPAKKAATKKPRARITPPK